MDDLLSSKPNSDGATNLSKQLIELLATGGFREKTIPRLELQAAVIAVRLKWKILEEIDFKVDGM